MEKWKDIKGFEDFYLVSDMGRVMSIAPGRATTNGRILSPRSDGKTNGYLTVRLYKGGRSFYLKVHRLVAQAFLPNSEGREQVNHKDGNKRNNCANNLEWVTAGENVRHAFETGLIEKGKDGIWKKAVRCIETGEVFESGVAAAREMKLGSSPAVGGGTIRTAVRGRTASRRAYGYHWEEAR